MKRLQAFKFEMRPNGQQQRQMRRFAGSCRVVFNEALALQKARHERGEKKLGYAGLCKELTAWRNGAPLPSGRRAPWLAEAPVHPQQQALKDLERAYTNFFARRADFPCFRKKGRSGSLRYPDRKQMKLDQGNSRGVLGARRNVTVSASWEKWFVPIQTEREVAQPLPSATGAIGIDVGITRFATFSDGTFLESLGSFRKREVRLARYQRAMSRKVKFSKNWRKAKAKGIKLDPRIGNARRDDLHKATTTSSQNHAMVGIEGLQVRNMLRSAAGTLDRPDRQVRAKSGLSKSVLDHGWAEFRRQLDYKLQWSGGWLLAMLPHNTSRTCPDCGHITADNRRTQAQLRCVACGDANHADGVGAINILSRGMEKLRDEGQDTAHAWARRKSAARIGCEAVQQCRQEQEPTEATQG